MADADLLLMTRGVLLPAAAAAALALCALCMCPPTACVYCCVAPCRRWHAPACVVLLRHFVRQLRLLHRVCGRGRVAVCGSVCGCALECMAPCTFFGMCCCSSAGLRGEGVCGKCCYIGMHATLRVAKYTSDCSSVHFNPHTRVWGSARRPALAAQGCCRLLHLRCYGSSGSAQHWRKHFCGLVA